MSRQHVWLQFGSDSSLASSNLTKKSYLATCHSPILLSAPFFPPLTVGCFSPYPQFSYFLSLLSHGAASPMFKKKGGGLSRSIASGKLDLLWFILGWNPIHTYRELTSWNLAGLNPCATSGLNPCENLFDDDLPFSAVTEWEDIVWSEMIHIKTDKHARHFLQIPLKNSAVICLTYLPWRYCHLNRLTLLKADELKCKRAQVLRGILITLRSVNVVMNYSHHFYE